MSHRIKLKVNWQGEIDGRATKVKAGKMADVPLEVARALVFERQIAELVPLEEIEEEVKRKPGRPRKKAVEEAPENKMLASASNK